jgi:hypothetical protein
MTVSIEIEVESEDCCKECGAPMGGKPATVEPSKDAMLAELKALLGNNSANGQADRQLKIDELMSKIQELGSGD